MPVRAARLALVLVLAACTGGDADAPASGDASSGAVDVEVRPLEEVLDAPIVVSADPSGTSATVTLTTTVPLACAAIYGEDDGFGMVATDADMAGAAIIDHAPVFLGLQPETDYRYVMQGSDAEGSSTDPRCSPSAPRRPPRWRIRARTSPSTGRSRMSAPSSRTPSLR